MKDFILKVIVASVIVGFGLYIFYYSVSPYENCIKQLIEISTVTVRDDTPFRTVCAGRTNW